MSDSTTAVIEKPREVLSPRSMKLTPEEAVRVYGDDVWRFVSSKLKRREDVEDVVMEVFGIACRKIRSLEKAESPKVWLLVVARRKAMDVHRRSYRRAEYPLATAENEAAGLEMPLREEIRTLINRLPDPYRDVLILKYVNGLETNEVAKIMRKSSQATNSLLQRARQAFKELGLAELPWLSKGGVK